MPRRGTRPTQAKVRAALFSSLAGSIPGIAFLDLFAGSGVVGLDAWSRGASFVCWVERSRDVLAVLERNVARLCGEESLRTVPGGEARAARVVLADAIGFLQNPGVPAPFDFVYMDPPYAAGRAGLVRKALQALFAGPILARNGLLVVEERRNTPPAEVPEGVGMVREREYGDTVLRFYRRQQLL